MGKFSIGDIVKLNFSDSIYSGKEFKVVDYKDGFYMLESDGYSCYGVSEEYLKVVEDSSMNNKELAFREVIAQIKEGEVWESECREIEFNNRGGVLINNKNGTKSDCYLFPPNKMFKLKRKKYTFEEAFKAYEEGKEIESCEDGEIYNKLKEDKGLDKLFNASQIRGKWYINNK